MAARQLASASRASFFQTAHISLHFVYIDWCRWDDKHRAAIVQYQWISGTQLAGKRWRSWLLAIAFHSTERANINFGSHVVYVCRSAGVVWSVVWLIGRFRFISTQSITFIVCECTRSCARECGWIAVLRTVADWLRSLTLTILFGSSCYLEEFLSPFVDVFSENIYYRIVQRAQHKRTT